MANTNCLAGMQCPECGSLEPFRIAVETTAVFWDEGSDPVQGSGTMTWNDDSYCKCCACDFEGTVLNFCHDEDPEDEDMQGPGSDSDPQTFLNYWHQGQADGHWNSPHGCHEQCPVCQEDDTSAQGATP